MTPPTAPSPRCCTSSDRGGRRARRGLFAVVAVTLCCTACERAAPPPTGAAAGGSPRATIERLIAAHESGSYQAMGDLIVPQRTHEVIKTLMAVDDFLRANRTLCEYVRDEFAPGLSQSVDQSRWGARLGVFSRYVELVDESIQGDTATVSFMVDDQLPLQRARLVRTNGAWRYDPGDGYNPRLPAAFQRMAHGLRRVLDDLKEGRLPADTVRADPQRLIEEVRVHLLPGIKMLPAGPTTQPGDS